MLEKLLPFDPCAFLWECYTKLERTGKNKCSIQGEGGTLNGTYVFYRKSFTVSLQTPISRLSFNPEIIPGLDLPPDLLR